MNTILFLQSIVVYIATLDWSMLLHIFLILQICKPSHACKFSLISACNNYLNMAKSTCLWIFELGRSKRKYYPLRCEHSYSLVPSLSVCGNIHILMLVQPHPSKWSYCITPEIEIYARANSYESYWRIITDCGFQRDWSCKWMLWWLNKAEGPYNGWFPLSPYLER